MALSTPPFATLLPGSGTHVTTAPLVPGPNSGELLSRQSTTLYAGLPYQHCIRAPSPLHNPQTQDHFATPPRPHIRPAIAPSSTAARPTSAAHRHPRPRPTN